MTYALYYWPTIQGRGEFVRLALAEANVPYVDVARGEGDATHASIDEVMTGSDVHPPFALPVLVDGERMIAQTANILLYLGRRLELAPDDETGRIWTHQLQLTLADWVDEIHDTHHPIGAELYYEEQREEALRRAEVFREYRLAKFMGYFERVLDSNSAEDAFLVGGRVTYADLSLLSRPTIRKSCPCMAG